MTDGDVWRARVVMKLKILAFHMDETAKELRELAESEPECLQHAEELASAAEIARGWAAGVSRGGR